MNLKIIVTTSDNYHHLLPLFIHLFQKFWSKEQEVEIVGYKKPDFELPSNFTFHSLGEWSGNKKDFSNDLRPYFEKQDDWFIWLFEDTFIKSFNQEKLNVLMDFALKYDQSIFNDNLMDIGRINLSDECCKQKHQYFYGYHENVIFHNTQDAEYRLSTQPSIWKRDFLLYHLKPDLSPWDFESQQPKYDGWEIIGMDRDSCPLKHNEGVTRHNIFKYNFNGMDEETLEELKQIIKNNEKS